jgi:hypothetical protein
MDVIKTEPESDSDTEPTLSEFESITVKQEDSSVPLCTVKIGLKQDTCGVKRDPDSLPAETAAFSMRELIAVKQELQEDAKLYERLLTVMASFQCTILLTHLCFLKCVLLGHL